MKKLLLHIVFLLISNIALSQNYAKLTCISVGEDGYITLNWDLLPINCVGITTNFYIYQSTQAESGFVFVDSVNITTKTSFTLTKLIPIDVVNYFYIKTSTSCGIFGETEKLSTINLELANDRGIAKLKWNQVLSLFPTQKYQIHREYPLGNWQIIASLNSNILNYNDTLHACGKIVNYKISTQNTCLQESNIVSDIFIDDIDPQEISINYISVNSETNNVQINWNTGKDEDVNGYTIYKLTSGWFPIAEVDGKLTNSYETISSQANTEVEKYRISAKDSCGNLSFMSTEHQTMLLTANYTNCSSSINLSWTPYVGWNQISKYEIWCNHASINYNLIGQVNGSQTIFNHTGIIPNSNYKYYIKAFNANGSFSSNSNVFTISTDVSNSLFTANYAKVVGENQVEISFNVDNFEEIKEYKILKSSSPNQNFETIAVYNNDKIQTQITYVDSKANTQVVNYYKLVAISTCDVIYSETNTISTISLKIENSSNLKHKLTWNNDSLVLNSDVEKFNIYRSIDDENFTLLTTLSGDLNLYIDDISDMDFTNVEGKFCYYIEAIEKMPNYSENVSNIACAVQFPRVFIPNAITPNDDGVNDELKPFSKFISTKDYVFIIYNRWGNKVFESNSPNESWNGKQNNKRVEDGVFTYYIHFITSDGSNFEDTGTITVF